MSIPLNEFGDWMWFVVIPLAEAIRVGYEIGKLKK